MSERRKRGAQTVGNTHTESSPQENSKEGRANVQVSSLQENPADLKKESRWKWRVDQKIAAAGA